MSRGKQQLADLLLLNNGQQENASLDYRVTTLERRYKNLVLALKQIQSGGTDHPSPLNKFMTASVTVADGDVACATAIAATPVGATAYVAVYVNGLSVVVGNGVKTRDCYFSGNAGVTARAFGAIVSGDLLYWNGSIAGYELAGTDRIDFLFDA